MTIPEHTYSAPVQTKNLVTNLFSFSISPLSGLSGCRDDGRARVQAPTVPISFPHSPPLYVRDEIDPITHWDLA